MVSIAQKVQIANRRAKVAHLKLTEPNLSSNEIADRVKDEKGKRYTYQTILNDLTAIVEDWKQCTLVDFSVAKGIQLARLEKIYDELWKAWEKSKTDFVSTTKHKHQIKLETKAKKGKKAKSRMMDDSQDVSERREQQCGDSRYMKLLMENVQMQCDLFGITVKDKEGLTSTPQIVSFNVIMPASMANQQEPKQIEQIQPEASDKNENHVQSNVDNNVASQDTDSPDDLHGLFIDGVNGVHGMNGDESNGSGM